jgi:hypothetical protein
MTSRSGLLWAAAFAVALATLAIPVRGGARVRVVVLVDGDRAVAAKALVRPGDTVLAEPSRIGRYTAVRLEVSAERARELADAPGVARVWPWTPPRMHDERSGQILAGAVDEIGRLTGTGYAAWLAERGLDPAAAPVVDVTDSGFDRGSTTDVPPEFTDTQDGSRVVYTRDFTLDAAPHDVSGHGTLNASIVAGLSGTSPDTDGYDLGIGIAPGARVGSSRIFNDRGNFALFAFYVAVSGPAFSDGARVSSNSWGSPANLYTPDSAEYDAIVRDADPETPGNQQLLVVFSAGNAGPGGHVETPGTAKNVITVGAAEGLRPGTDGCGVGPTGADSAFDVAFFSSGGPVDDGRVKPDLLAPGTHVTGTRSRADGYSGDGVCAEGFTGDRDRFTWSSGTSHAAPAVSGAAALLHAYLERERGAAPSPALVKAWLLNTTRYLASAGDDLPSPRQGWGLLDLARALDGASRVVVDQNELLTFEGDTREWVCVPVDVSRPVRVTLVWTDAVGDPGTAPEENDLDLEVESGGLDYRGNRFSRDRSVAGGPADTRNNVEGVWLAPGAGPHRLRGRARALEGDGVPGNAFRPDQDFALVVYNARVQAAPLVRIAAAEVAAVDPGGEGLVRLTLENTGTAAAPPVSVTLEGGAGVTVLDGADQTPALAPGGSARLERGFRIALDGSVPCGAPLGLVAHVGGAEIPVAARSGGAVEEVVFEDDVEGAPRWTFETGNRGATWVTTTERSHGGARSWHAGGSSVSGDSWIVSDPIAIPAGAIAAELSFWHTFGFERGFDGGVLEVSDGGAWADLGSLVAEGGYPLNISGIFGNTLGTRPAWTGGRPGDFSLVRADLTPFAGRTIRLRLRIGADARTSSDGWYADDFRVSALAPSCATPGGTAPRVATASYRNGKLKLKGEGFAAESTIEVNGRTVAAPAKFVAAKGVLRVKAAADALALRPGLNVVTVTTAGRASRAFALVL